MDEMAGQYHCIFCHRDVTTNTGGDVYCSEFCATTSSAEKARWLAANPGDHVVHPCYECGVAIDDMYYFEGVCGECGPLVRLKRLLKECLPYVPEDLATRVNIHLVK